MQKVFSFVLVCLVLFVCASAVLAVDVQTPLGKAGTAMGFEENPDSGELPRKIGAILKVFIGALSIVLAGYIVFGGYLWMSAGGNEEQIKKAKAHITNAIIGLVICLFAYAITSFVVSNIATEVLTP